MNKSLSINPSNVEVIEEYPRIIILTIETRIQNAHDCFIKSIVREKFNI
jgi:hypothetical protein